jgi:hypothetical protein
MRQQTIGEIIDQIKAVFVIDRRHVRLSHGKTNSISETLA